VAKPKDNVKAKKSVFVCLVLVGAALIAVLVAGNFLMAPAPQSIGELPSDLSGKSIEFSSGSGSTIRGWLIPGKQGGGAVVLMHGVRSNRLSMIDRARFLSRAGYSVLLFDFQAHGESTGKHISFGALESKDAQAALEFLRQVAPGERIGVIGVSMGGAAAILASPTLQADAFVLEMVYPTIDDAVTNRLTMRLGSWARVLTPLFVLQLKPRLGIDKTELRPIDHVRQLNSPKLFIAGADDLHTTIEESERLYETASQPKEFWVIQGAKHVDLHHAAPTEYESRVLEFFQKNLR
jgi:fermentation-respiration switch protein FrsA (DUF1100 family)